MARKRASGGAVFGDATAAADAMHQQDQAVAVKSEQQRGQKTKLPLNRIGSRAEDTRALDIRHVIALTESIAALGLIEPLVVDEKGVLLAGAHRLAAIKTLQEEHSDLYKQHFPDNLIQVHMLPFDAEKEKERALQVELAENEKRVNYTRKQIEKLADRLRNLDYRDIPGRPKAGEKALGPALAVAIGVSTRYVRKILKEQGQEDQEIRNSVPIFQKQLRALKRAESAFMELESYPLPENPTQAEVLLSKSVQDLLKKVRSNINRIQQEMKRQK